MDATTTRSERLPRFSVGERWVHWCVAALLVSCLLTAAALSLAPVSELIGRRAFVARVHVWSGLLLPVPILLGLLSRAFRADARILARFQNYDHGWLTSPRRRDMAVGKFNPGQKLNASFLMGAVLVMLGTGFVMWQNQMWPLSWRTGATFVHDWLAFALALVVVGHVWMALRHPAALRAIVRGDIDLAYAEAEHRLWVDELRPASEEDESRSGSRPQR